MPALAPSVPTAAENRVANLGEIDQSLRLGFRLLDAAEAFAAGFADLDDIELPPVLHTEANQADLRAVAPLYLAAELESAYLLPSVELLAKLFVTGGLPIRAGEGAQALMNFWRTRKERFSPEERAAFFAHLFGYQTGLNLADSAPHSANFEPLLRQMAQLLAEFANESLRSAWARRPSDAALRSVAAQLATFLAARSGGITAFAAREILDANQQALSLLKYPEVQSALAARNVWTALRSIAERFLSASPDIINRVTRGQSGQLLLGWLAEALPQLEALGPPLINSDDQIIGAAIRWVQASDGLIDSTASQ
jgi:hypothetical protein